MNCKEANQIPIEAFLRSLGIEPKSASGNSLWYLSPLHKENKPSFKVDTKINCWYDHGIGKGGTLVDLGTQINKVSIDKFLESITRKANSFSFHQPRIVEKIERPTITEIKPLQNSKLLSYLSKRCIPIKVAQHYCEEIYFNSKEKRYFSIGFKNDSSGYEIRNPYFKGCLDKKDITSINADPIRICLFEGFIDFLSAIRLMDNLSKSSIIVLNSINMIERAKSKLNERSPGFNLEVYFDNDEAGKRGFEFLKGAFPQAIDQSSYYAGFKDLNEMLVARTTRTKKQNIQIGM